MFTVMFLRQALYNFAAILWLQFFTCNIISHYKSFVILLLLLLLLAMVLVVVIVVVLVVVVAKKV
jgi:hypothetical protein